MVNSVLKLYVDSWLIFLDEANLSFKPVIFAGFTTNPSTFSEYIFFFFSSYICLAISCCSFFQNDRKSELNFVQSSKNSWGGVQAAEVFELKNFQRRVYLLKECSKVSVCTVEPQRTRKLFSSKKRIANINFIQLQHYLHASQALPYHIHNLAK